MNRNIILGIITNIDGVFAKVSTLQAVSPLILTTTLRLSCSVTSFYIQRSWGVESVVRTLLNYKGREWQSQDLNSGRLTQEPLLNHAVLNGWAKCISPVYAYFPIYPFWYSYVILNSAFSVCSSSQFYAKII